MYDVKKQKLYTKEQKNSLLSSDFLENTVQQSFVSENLSEDFQNDITQITVEDFQASTLLNKESKTKKEKKAALKKYENIEAINNEEKISSEYTNEYDENFEDSLYEDDDLYSEDYKDEYSYNEEEKNETISSNTKKEKPTPTAAPFSCVEFEKGYRMWDEFDHKEQEEIVKHYAPKIRFIALRMKGKLPKHIELSELISSGTVGLIEALKKFKPQLGIRFDSYAESRIRGAMIDELRRLDWFPRSLRTKAKDIKQAIWNLEHEIGRTPTTLELSEYTGLPEKEIESTLEAIDGQLCLSLDSIQETMASVNNSGNEEDPYQSAAFTELVDKVAGLIETLTPREKLVLSLYYNDELNMREASEVMEVTEGRVSQLHTQAINKLRKIFAEQYQDSL